MSKSKYSNEFKSDCIYYGVVDFVKHKKKEVYKTGNTEEVLTWLSYFQSKDETDCALRLIESEYRKYAKARNKIYDLVVNGQAVFITLTFTDEILAKTSAQTRRRYVARYLKGQSPFYVANVDFSPTKQREHYHAVVSKRCDMSKWSYGFAYVEQVRTQDHDAKRVARYVAKLTNHALKVKGLSTRLIYSRDVV